MEENKIDNIGANELVFNVNKDEQIYSGGFNVKSIMMKAGMSPIMTLNTDQVGGGSDKVSDLFKNLVVPSWTLSYPNMNGGAYKDHENDDDSDSDSDIDDDLHDKLLNLVRESDDKLNKKKTKNTKNSITKKQTVNSKHGGTKRNKKNKENKENKENK
jgi:hypothetical protein